MRKFFIIMNILFFFFTGCMTVQKGEEKKEELRGVWYSFFDWETLPKEKTEFQNQVESIVKNVKKVGLNTIFLHIHSHSDSYYLKSSYFPLSRRAFGDDLTSKGYDPLEVFIEEAHKENIEIHGWLNPYRIGSQQDYDLIPEGNIIADWKKSPEKRNILLHKGAYYLNPAKDEVQDLFVNAVKEICLNYDIDGIHLDDYFYPALDDSIPELSFDMEEYNSAESGRTIVQWRRDNVSRLIEKIHQAVGESSPEIPFGISPHGNLDNLASTRNYFVDIEEWLSCDRYIDYIMPQLYWGFESKKSNGDAAPWAFKNNMDRWVSLVKGGPVKLYAGLALYKSMNDFKEGNEVSEWIRCSDIIARQIVACREEEYCSGFSIFDYRDLLREEAGEEVKNIKKLM